ncbi:GumC family protein [Thiocystis violacea]|uniref:GumC family protein n=1 Tax=Thiocystis violacea TaxID=13725 RepID=UPI00190872DC|nr:GumC family protein [Thiocystis violacea]MBK1719137.1 hypothetical protein [Thiocystis violacea]
MNIRSLLKILRARLWVILLLPLLSAGIAFALLERQPIVYAAQAKLLIDYRTPLEGELAGELLPVGLQESYVATQLQIIKSQRVANDALVKLRLANDPDWVEGFEAEGLPGQSFESWAVPLLLDNLVVTIGKDSRLVSLWYSDTDPKRAANIANAFVDAYREINQELGHTPAIESARAVEPLIGQLRAELEDAERKLSSYQQRAGILATDEQLDLETSQLRVLGEQRLVAEAKAREAESRLASLERMESRGKMPDTLPDMRGNELIERLQIEIARKEAVLAERATTLGKRHPEMQRLEADLATTRASLEAEKTSLLGALRRELREVRGLAEGARRSEAEQKEKVLGLKTSRDGLQPLLREMQSARESYDRSLRMHSEYATHGRLNQGNVSVLDPAEPPFLPANSSLMMSLAAAFMGGFVLAIGLILAWELLDRRVRTRYDILDMGAGPFLGELPRA